MTFDERVPPIGLQGDLFDMAVDYISKHLPQKEDFSRKTILDSVPICSAFQVLRNLPMSFFDTSRPQTSFAQLWPHAFLWAKYLWQAAGSLSSKDDEDICKQFAAGIASFFDTTARCIQTCEKFLIDAEMIGFVLEFWISKDLVADVRTHAAHAMNSYHALTGYQSLDVFYKTIPTYFESPDALAAFAISRARDARHNVDFQTMPAHYGVLYLLLRPFSAHPSRTALLEKGVLPFVVDSLSFTLNATYKPFESRMNTLRYCLTIIQSICGTSDAGNPHLPRGLRHGLLEAYFKVGQILTRIDEDERVVATDILTKYIPVFLHLKPVLQAVHQGMTCYTRKLRNRPFDTGSLQGGFKDIWEDFEILTLEHCILRRIHSLRGRECNVYCGYVCLFTLPLIIVI